MGFVANSKTSYKPSADGWLFSSNISRQTTADGELILPNHSSIQVLLFPLKIAVVFLIYYCKIHFFKQGSGAVVKTKVSNRSIDKSERNETTNKSHPSFLKWKWKKTWMENENRTNETIWQLFWHFVVLMTDSFFFRAG